MLNCAGICLCLIFFWLNSLANWKEFRGINSWLLKVSMQWRGNVSFCDRLGDLKEEQLKRSTSLTWVHCKKGDSVFGRLFGLLFKSLPVWCLLVLRVVLLLGGGGTFSSCFDQSICLKDAFALWRSRSDGSLCCVSGHNSKVTVPLPKPFSFTMNIFLTRMIYSRSFKAIERLQGFLPEYWRSSQRRKKLRAVSCEELPWRAQVQICTNMFWC